MSLADAIIEEGPFKGWTVAEASCIASGTSPAIVKQEALRNLDEKINELRAVREKILMLPDVISFGEGDAP